MRAPDEMIGVSQRTDNFRGTGNQRDNPWCVHVRFYCEMSIISFGCRKFLLHFHKIPAIPECRWRSLSEIGAEMSPKATLRTPPWSFAAESEAHADISGAA